MWGEGALIQATARQREDGSWQLAQLPPLPHPACLFRARIRCWLNAKIRCCPILPRAGASLAELAAHTGRLLSWPHTHTQRLLSWQHTR
eukprot:366076-Chlamydomonas_euryale.AAC.6